MGYDMCYYDVIAYALNVHVVYISDCNFECIFEKTPTAVPFGSSSFTVKESGTFA